MSAAMGSDKNVCSGALGPSCEWAFDIPTSQRYEKCYISGMDLRRRHLDTKSVSPRRASAIDTESSQIHTDVAICDCCDPELRPCPPLNDMCDYQLGLTSAEDNILLSLAPVFYNDNFLDCIPLSLAPVESINTSQVDVKSKPLEDEGALNSGAVGGVGFAHSSRKVCGYEPSASSQTQVHDHNIKGEAAIQAPFQDSASIPIVSSQISAQRTKYVDTLPIVTYPEKSHHLPLLYPQIYPSADIQENSIHHNIHIHPAIQPPQCNTAGTLDSLECPSVYPTKVCTLYRRIAPSTLLSPHPQPPLNWENQEGCIVGKTKTAVMSDTVYFDIGSHIAPMSGGYVPGMHHFGSVYCNEARYHSDETHASQDGTQKYHLQAFGGQADVSYGQDAWDQKQRPETKTQVTAVPSKKKQVYNVRRGESESGEFYIENKIAEKNIISPNVPASKASSTNKKKISTQDSSDVQRASTDRHGGTRLSVTAVRNFECRLCLKRFLRRQDLNRHEATHMPGYKPYHCSSCGIGFTRQDALHRHSKSGRCMGITSKA